MQWSTDGKKLAVISAVFLSCFWLPVGSARFDNAVLESLQLLRSYAREHVLLCLIPAFFIAGAVSIFVSRDSVMKYLGARAHKVVAYGVASLAGSILAICSCTILPLFAGIYKMGAGLGPATAFLYAGPAINVLAIILTARILGLEMGIARAVGAILFSVVIGLLMHLIYRREELQKVRNQMAGPEPQVERSLGKNALLFGTMIGIVVFANWARSGDIRAVFLCCPGGLSAYELEGTLLNRTDDTVKILDRSGETHEISTELLQDVRNVAKRKWYESIFRIRWALVLILLGLFLVMMTRWYSPTEQRAWVTASWGFARQILPLLLLGVLFAGLLLGRPQPGHAGLIPTAWINAALGGNSIRANFSAAIAGAFMYFATLTEVPILQGLMGAGMGKGPALALLLAGPALSLPNMLVIRSVMGTRKTAVFVTLVIVMATLSGIVFGLIC